MDYEWKGSDNGDRHQIHDLESLLSTYTLKGSMIASKLHRKGVYKTVDNVCALAGKPSWCRVEGYKGS